MSLTKEQAREIATKLVKQHEEKIDGYLLVSVANAINLIQNGELFEKLLHDPIRGVCPSNMERVFYSWNIVDYLTESILLEDHYKQTLREIAASKKELEGFGKFKVTSFKIPESLKTNPAFGDKLVEYLRRIGKS